MVSNCNVGATTYTVCWVGTDRGADTMPRMPRLSSGCVVTCRQALTKGLGALLCKHFRCKVTLLLGEHWPRGSTGRRPVRKKRPAKRVFFFWFPLRFSDASSRSGLTDFSPHSNIYLSIYRHSLVPWYHEVKQRRAHRCRQDRHGRKVSLAKRSSERLTLSTLNWTLKF